MSTGYLVGRAGLVSALALGLCLSAGAQAGEATKTTLENLQAAYNGESNAKARYEAFAAKADEEGYGQVASLFRAAARSESIHIANHAKVIGKLGAEPQATVPKPEVKSTKENVEAALKGETYERDVMYPAFLKKAEADKNPSATETFKFALGAETEHAKLYKEALDNLDAWKTGTKEFLVCTVCGFTTANLKLVACPVDGSPRGRFVTVK